MDSEGGGEESEFGEEDDFGEEGSSARGPTTDDESEIGEAGEESDLGEEGGESDLGEEGDGDGDDDGAHDTKRRKT